MQPDIHDLITWAHQAGEILRAGYEQKHEVLYKGETNPVTEIDKRSEALLIRRIRERFPEHTIITEESGLLAGQNRHCWYIDPLDGTVSYAHGLPLFAVTLAYAEEPGGNEPGNGNHYQQPQAQRADREQNDRDCQDDPQNKAQNGKHDQV